MLFKFAIFLLLVTTSVSIARSLKVPHRTIVANAGDNVTITCGGIASSSSSVHSGRSNGSTIIVDVNLFDAKTYTCVNLETNEPSEIITLAVKSVPPSVTNLSVKTHSTSAKVSWLLLGDGGYPVTNVVLAYKLGRSSHTKKVDNFDEKWQTISGLQYTDSSATIHGLQPNSTYYFRVYAINALGPGPNVSVIGKTMSLEEEKNEENEKSEELSIYMKITIIVVIIAVLSFTMIVMAISLILFKNCTKMMRQDNSCETSDDDENLELVPNIILNPTFNIGMLEYLESDDKSPTEGASAAGIVTPDGQLLSIFGDRPNFADGNTELSSTRKLQR